MFNKKGISILFIFIFVRFICGQAFAVSKLIIK